MNVHLKELESMSNNKSLRACLKIQNTHSFEAKSSLIRLENPIFVRNGFLKASFRIL